MSDTAKRIIWTENFGYVFERAEQVHKVIIPKGYKAVFIARDGTRETVPIDEPGTYEVDVAWARDSSLFPILLAIVPEVEAGLLTGNGKITRQQRRYLERHGKRSQ